MTDPLVEVYYFVILYGVLCVSFVVLCVITLKS